MRVLILSGNGQKYQAEINHLTHGGRGGGGGVCLGVYVNLMMCERGVHCTLDT
jgi:hypothetical protein